MRLLRIREVKALDGFRLRLTLTDGLARRLLRGRVPGNRTGSTRAHDPRTAAGRIRCGRRFRTERAPNVAGDLRHALCRGLPFNGLSSLDICMSVHIYK
jgi:hypothetical protein